MIANHLQLVNHEIWCIYGEMVNESETSQLKQYPQHLCSLHRQPGKEARWVFLVKKVSFLMNRCPHGEFPSTSSCNSYTSQFCWVSLKIHLSREKCVWAATTTTTTTTTKVNLSPPVVPIPLRLEFNWRGWGGWGLRIAPMKHFPWHLQHVAHKQH